MPQEHPRKRKITVRIFEEDHRLLKEVYGKTADGYQKHIRAAVHVMAENLRRKLAEMRQK